MLVQSGGGKVYAVLADNHDFELAIMPTLNVVSTTVFLALRCRYKVKTAPMFDPMLVPKRVLAGGVERSDNTLRSMAVINTEFMLTKIGPSFPPLIAERIRDQATLHYLCYDQSEAPPAPNFIGPTDVRQDFIEDCAKLVEHCIGPIYPPKDFGHINQILTVFDFNNAVAAANDIAAAQASSLTVAVDNASENPPTSDAPNVQKVDFGAMVDKPEPADV